MFLISAKEYNIPSSQAKIPLEANQLKDCPRLTEASVGRLKCEMQVHQLVHVVSRLCRRFTLSLELLCPGSE